MRHLRAPSTWVVVFNIVALLALIAAVLGAHTVNVVLAAVVLAVLYDTRADIAELRTVVGKSLIVIAERLDERGASD